MTTCTDMLRVVDPRIRWSDVITVPVTGYTIWREMNIIDEIMKGVGIPAYIFRGEQTNETTDRPDS